MKLFVIYIGIIACMRVSSRQYGFLFNEKGSYIQTFYTMLCGESIIKLELFINTTTGVVLYAENKIQESSILVYFKRPGLYVNATSVGKQFNLHSMVDFFNNEWFGWHEIEIRLGPTRSSLVFDGILREGDLLDKFLFPESDVEDNLIYFGRDLRRKGEEIDSFKGLMRNYQYKSCGCNLWQPMKIVGTYGVSLDNLGDCSKEMACRKGCTCILFHWGGRKCDCSGLECPPPDDDIFYEFDDKPNSLVHRQLKLISYSDGLQYRAGIFGESLRIDSNQWMVLSVQQGRTCFKNIFFCGNEYLYQFWIRPLVSEKMESETRILKHASSITSIYGLEITRIQNTFQIIFTDDSNKQFKLMVLLPELVWNRVTVSFNKTHLKLFLNSDLLKSVDNSITLDQEKPKVINTRFLFVGNNISNSNIEIDHFHFSTNINTFLSPSIQEMRLEQHRHARKTYPDCHMEMKTPMINMTKCFLDQFRNSNYSMGFYASLIFYTDSEDLPVSLIESSIFDLHLTSQRSIDFSMKNDVNRTLILRKTLNNLYYLEISILPGNRLMVFQDIDTLLVDSPFNLALLGRETRRPYVLVNGNWMILKELVIMNINKDIGTRALRIPTNKPTNYAMDFDSLNSDTYSSIMLSEGYLDLGIQLKHPKNEITGNWFEDSCVRNARLCYHGLTVLFWLKIGFSPELSNGGFVRIFSSGNAGITLLLDKDRNFILIIQKLSTIKFLSDKSVSLFNNWCLVELSVSANKIASLFINSVEYKPVEFIDSNIFFDCDQVCFGDKIQESNSIVLFIDEINTWDIGREFLYANGYLSRGISPHKLYSFTNYQLGQGIQLYGSAKLIPTKYGQGVALNGVGPRFATADIPSFINCFSRIENCRRGIMILLWLRIDNLALSNQIFLSSPQITIGSKLRSLFVRMSSGDQTWIFISKEILHVFLWQVIVISWRMNNGMKIYLNGEFIGHVMTGNEEKLDSSFSNSFLYFGKDHLEKFSDYATVLVDDFHIFEADRNNLVFESVNMDNVSCILRHDYDDKKNAQSLLQLGVIGNAGLFYKNMSTERKYSFPDCFNEPVSGCKDCVTVRFWVNLNSIDINILHARDLNVSVYTNNFLIDITDRGNSQFIKYSCPYINRDLIKNWNFLEISWDNDEGLQVFVNRELLSCGYTSKIFNQTVVSKEIVISSEFDGAIDELEMFKSRISMLYLNRVVDEGKIDLLLQKLRDKKELQKEMIRLANSSRQGNVNVTVKFIQSFEFNGSNYLEYKMPNTVSNMIPGSKEEIEISFKSLDTVASSILWVSEGNQSKSILSLKYQSLYFTKIYLLPSSNGSRRVTEELEIYQNIKPNVVYNLVIYQKSGEFVMKITSVFESTVQSMVGRENLIPMNSNIYFGGYQNKSADTNSSFVGVIYKARVKSIFNREAVDIIKEMAAAKTNPDIINHGDVKAIMKSTEMTMPAKASFLGTIIDRKMPLMVNNPFISITLPVWDFELLVSFEIEFSTFESRGLIIFIGNSSHFIAVEMFDSQLYFLYKSSTTWKKSGIHESNYNINDNKPHNVYLGRDLFGNIKVFFDRKEILSNVQIPKEFENSSSVIGYFGSDYVWPLEIMSRTGFVGCFHFIGIHDIGYLNFSRWIPQINTPIYNFIQIVQPVLNFAIGSCLSPSEIPCQLSPCQGGWCQSTSVSANGQLSNNFKCNCLFASKSLDNNFTEFSPMKNFNTWISNYLMESRTKSCTEDTPQIIIFDKSYVKIDFDIQFPFSSVLDFEFLIMMKSVNGCIATISNGKDQMELIVIKGTTFFLLNENLNFFMPDINISDGQWHSVQLNLRFGMIRFKIDNVYKAFDSTSIYSLKISTITIGTCSKFTESHLQIKHFMYNSLNLLQNIYNSTKNLFYKSEYVYPTFKQFDVDNTDQFTDYPVTFLSNFDNAITKSPIKLSWLNKIEFQLDAQHSGSFVHLQNGNKFLSLIVCNNISLAIVYKDSYLDSQRLGATFESETFRFRITLNLMKGFIEFENMDTNDKKQITKDMYSWNIGDNVHLEFGRNIKNYKMITSETNNFDHEHCLKVTMNMSFIGCIQRFALSNDKSLFNVNEMWMKFMQASSSLSVSISQCQGVQKCLRDSCVHGKCEYVNFQKVFCNCTATKFIGLKCQIPIPVCQTNSCENNGRCGVILLSPDEPTITCNCDNTGFQGKRCEEPICRTDSCLNNGQCQVRGDLFQCDCSKTGYYGARCEIYTCNSSICGEQGLCRIDSKWKTPYCDCNKGYIGEFCTIKDSGKCRGNCLNGGICASFNPVIKLCSNKYCQWLNESKCSCDLTSFRGEFCEKLEFGFNPDNDGIVFMDQLVRKKTNYLRVLFQSLDFKKSMALMYLSFNKYNYLKIYVEHQDLYLQYQSEFSEIGKIHKLGPMENTNNLLLVSSPVEINYYLNSKPGHILLFHSQPRNINANFSVRRKRNIDNGAKLFLGSNSLYEEKFVGLIAGFRWNGRQTLDGRNRYFKNNTFFPIDRLHTRPFPHQTSYMVEPDSYPPTIYLLISVVVVLVIMFVVCVIRKARSPCRRISYFNVSVYSTPLTNTNQSPEKECLMMHSNHEKHSEKIDKRTSIDSDETVLKMTSFESYAVKENNIEESTSIVLVKDCNDLNNLVILDILVIPRMLQFALVINTDPHIKIFQRLFPIHENDNVYNYVSIQSTPDSQYAYCHMRHKQCEENDLLELQVWKIDETWKRHCQPPNIAFTDSAVIPDCSPRLILMNRHSSILYMWDLKNSNLTWKTALDSLIILPELGHLSVSQDAQHLYFSNNYEYNIVDINDENGTSQITRGDLPFPSSICQVLSLQRNKFFIRAKSGKVYLYNATSKSFSRKRVSHQIVLLAKNETRGKLHLAMATNNGEIYLTNDIEENQHQILGPKHQSQIICLQFSANASLVCAGYEHNLIHVWKIDGDISLCHFHAVHGKKILRELQFSGDDRYIIATSQDSSNIHTTEKFLIIINRN